MKIVLHPANKHLLDNFIKKNFPQNKIKQDNQDNIWDSTKYFQVSWPLAKVVYNESIPKDRGTGRYKVKQSKYYTYWDGQGKPPSWCLYFGFVEEEMEPNIYMIEDKFLGMYYDFGLKIDNKFRSIMQSSC